MIDDPDDQTDYHIAHHIVRVHQKREDALAPAFTTAELKRYIAYAKTLKPKVCSLSYKWDAIFVLEDFIDDCIFGSYNGAQIHAAKPRGQKIIGGFLCCTT